MDEQAKPDRRGRDAVETAGKGAMMGAADLVPGVSGGTVALVVGIHPRLVAAIAAFDLRLPADAWRAVRGDGDARASLGRLDLGFLAPLLAGMGLAILAGSSLVHAGLEARPDLAMALFFGMIAASVRIPWRRREEPSASHAIPLVLAAIVTVAVVSWQGASVPTTTVGLLGAGMIALTAMLLPGISGSGLLVLMGIYEPILAAVSELRLRMLVPFAVGGILGLMAASRALRWLFRNHNDHTLAVLTGLLLGSLVRVWPWRSEGGFAAGDLATPSFGADALLLVLVAFLGVMVVVVSDLVAQKR